MKWHRLDPVSRKEVDRNNGMQQVQNNRNPFIDYPILAEFLWGNRAGQVFSFNNAIASFDPEFVLGVSDGWKEGGTNPEEALDTPNSAANARKVLIEGQLYIVIDDQIFNIMGQQIK